MNNFFKSGAFPSNMPIRAVGTKVIELADIQLTKTSDPDVLSYLKEIKKSAELEPEKMFYFTVDRAKQLGIL